MRYKTFLATYLLFVLIFFASLGVVSIYMTNSQLGMLKEKSKTEFNTIAATFAKDLAVLQGRLQDSFNFEKAVNGLIEEYQTYYRKNQISLELEALPDNTNLSDAESGTELSFARDGQKQLLCISGSFSGAFGFYRLDYAGDVSENLAELRHIQHILLLLAMAFSVITACILYLILSGIFKPLVMVSSISRKIAGGQYSERIYLKGGTELSSMAEDFNRMAAEIEKHIGILKEEAVQKQQFVDQFAHEIRTPLTSIYGYAEYMQKARLTEEDVIESAQLIMKEAGYMRKISESLLELATLRDYTAQKRAISLPCLLEDVARSLRGMVGENRIEIICDCGVPVLYGQEDLLRSLLLNLGFNALKACDGDGGLVCLAASAETGGVVLSVTDNGCGIPEESLEKVEEPFYRVDKARSRESGGAGLGLALCKQIALAHHAEMRIRSALGKGTRVEIRFPTEFTTL